MEQTLKVVGFQRGVERGRYVAEANAQNVGFGGDFCQDFSLDRWPIVQIKEVFRYAPLADSVTSPNFWKPRPVVCFFYILCRTTKTPKPASMEGRDDYGYANQALEGSGRGLPTHG
jgi:hypothetical protein